MGTKSDYAENKVLDHLLGTTALTMPTQVYIALMSVTPSDGSAGTELTGNGYARQAANFGAAASGAAANTNLITFTASGGAWSAVAGLAIMDALTAGNVLYWETRSLAALGDGDKYDFAIGDIDVTED
jgi:hypothetical protein